MIKIIIGIAINVVALLVGGTIVAAVFANTTLRADEVEYEIFVYIIEVEADEVEADEVEYEMFDDVDEPEVIEVEVETSEE